MKRLNPFEEVNVGDTVVFQCQFRAVPDPTVHWYKDDQDITEGGNTILECDPNTGNACLILENVTRNDEGAYKCKAENQEGVASTTGYLSVTGS